MGRFFNRTSETTGSSPNSVNRDEVSFNHFGPGRVEVFIGDLYIGDAASEGHAQQVAEEWIEQYRFGRFDCKGERG